MRILLAAVAAVVLLVDVCFNGETLFACEGLSLGRGSRGHGVRAERV